MKKTQLFLSDIIGKLSEKSVWRTAMWVVLLSSVFFVMLIINTLTPLLADDFYYSRNLIYGTDSVASDIGDVFVSAVNVYKQNSGRVLTHFTYHFFGFWGKGAFNIINAAAYVAVTLLIYNIVRGRKKHSISLYLLVNLSIWLCTPELGQDIFWLSGTVNYLLPMIPILILINLYSSYACEQNETSTWVGIVVGILGIIAGWQLENSSITVPVVAALYLWYYKKFYGKIPVWAISGFIGSIIGYVALVAAPGNYKRLDAEAESVSLSLPFKFAMITYYWVMFVGILTAIFLVLAIVCYKSKHIKELMQGCIFAIAALVSAYCMLAAPTSPERTWFITIIMLTVADGILLHTVCGRDNVSVKAAICVCALIILGTMSADTIITSYEINQQFSEREQTILTAKEDGQTVIEVPIYSHKYPFKANCSAEYGLYDVELGENAPNSFNGVIADYYGVEKIIGIER